MADKKKPYDYDGAGCEWDRMSPWQKKWAYVFFISLISWGAPVYEQTFGINLPSWVMPVAGITAIVSGLLSGMIFIILKSFGKN
ncbi:MAG: hypothetical protein U9P50_02845 [Patescibacteria group bacterium]|nr:hypothetical protein [Patescibacteria group bacterium]